MYLSQWTMCVTTIIDRLHLKGYGTLHIAVDFKLNHEAYEAVSQKDHTLKCYRNNSCAHVFPEKKIPQNEKKRKIQIKTIFYTVLCLANGILAFLECVLKCEWSKYLFPFLTQFNFASRNEYLFPVLTQLNFLGKKIDLIFLVLTQFNFEKKI